MKNRINKSIATLGVFALCSGSAFAIADTGTLTLGRTAGYFDSNGGEFTLTPTGADPGTLPLTLDDYGAGVSISSTSFQSFCIEYNESTASPVDYKVNSASVLGGRSGGTPSDPLSVGTSYLYSQFATGSLVGSSGTAYDYTAGVGRMASAVQLQIALWMLEGEILPGETLYNLSNDFHLKAVTEAGSLAAAEADAASGANGVYALNLTEGRVFRQDMLYFEDKGRRVPDSGMTVMLLGLALGGLGLVRRFKGA